METTAKTRSRPALAAVVLACVVAFVAGAVVAAVASNAFGPVRVDRQVGGVVTLVNADGSSLCLTEDNGGEVCTDLLKRSDSPMPVVGQKITGVVVWTPVSTGTAQALILTSGS